MLCYAKLGYVMLGRYVRLGVYMLCLNFSALAMTELPRTIIEGQKAIVIYSKNILNRSL